MSEQPPLRERASAVRAVVRQDAGKPTLFIDDEPVYPMLYALTDCPGGRWSFEEVPRWNLTNFSGLGIRLFQVDLWLQQIFDDSEPIPVLDLELARRQVRGVLEVCPDAAIFIRLHVNASPAWTAAHPRECTKFADVEIDESAPSGLRRPLDGDEINTRRVSLASRLWLEDSTEKVRRLLTALADTPEGDRLAGVQVACGVFGEWHYWGFIDHEPDTGPAMTAAFSTWLRHRYRSDEALRTAWADPTATLAAATVPDAAERAAVDDGIFRDPRRRQRVVDYYECQHEVVADSILQLCRVVRTSWPRPIVTGTFYGYFFMMFGRQAAGGHLRMAQVLASPDVDYLSAPMSYQGYCRRIGGPGHGRGVLGACARHGKLWLDEMDQYTHLGDPHAGQVSELADDVAIIRRNVAQSYTRGMGLWFYDFGPQLVSGWWDHPELLEEIRRIREVFDRLHRKPFRRAADVLVVYDTECFYHLAHTWRVDCVSHVAVDELTAALYHTGAAFDDALLFELPELDLTPYRVVVFANTFVLTDAQRAWIGRHVAGEGRHVLWNGYPGYSNGARLDPGFTAELVGMDLARSDPRDAPVLRVDPPFGPAAIKLWHPVPLLVVDDDTARAYGHLEGTPDVAFAANTAAATSWFASVPLADPAPLRELFRRAGVHLYSEAGDVTIAGGGVIGLHTERGGPRQVRLRDGRSVDVLLPARSTVVLDADTGQQLLPDVGRRH